MATAADSSASGSQASLKSSRSSLLESNDAWSSAAEGYSNMSWAQYPLHSGRAGLDAVQLRPGESFLDVACGPGDLALDAAQRKGAVVDCIDFSSGMIEIVQQKLQTSPASVTPHIMHGQNLTFADATFDVTCSCFGVMLFPDWHTGLKEMVRVTKPGGRLLVVVPDADSKGRPGMAAIELLMQVLESQFPDVLPLSIPKGMTALGSANSMYEELASRGLKNVQVTKVDFALRTDDLAGLVRNFMKVPFMQEVQKKLSSERWAELSSAIKKSFEESAEDGMFCRSMAALVAVASKP